MQKLKYGDLVESMEKYSRRRHLRDLARDFRDLAQIIKENRTLFACEFIEKKREYLVHDLLELARIADEVAGKINWRGGE